MPDVSPSVGCGEIPEAAALEGTPRPNAVGSMKVVVLVLAVAAGTPKLNAAGDCNGPLAVTAGGTPKSVVFATGGESVVAVSEVTPNRNGAVMADAGDAVLILGAVKGAAVA